jgi:hypothetical protein
MPDGVSRPTRTPTPSGQPHHRALRDLPAQPPTGRPAAGNRAARQPLAHLRVSVGNRAAGCRAASALSYRRAARLRASAPPGTAQPLAYLWVIVLPGAARLPAQQSAGRPAAGSRATRHCAPCPAAGSRATRRCAPSPPSRRQAAQPPAPCRRALGCPCPAAGNRAAGQGRSLPMCAVVPTGTARSSRSVPAGRPGCGQSCRWGGTGGRRRHPASAGERNPPQISHGSGAPGTLGRATPAQMDSGPLTSRPRNRSRPNSTIFLA